MNSIPDWRELMKARQDRMTMEAIQERDPIEEYWATHKPRFVKGTGFTDGTGQTAFEWYYEDQRRENPWCNGRYAFAAIVWGLISMLLLSVSP